MGEAWKDITGYEGLYQVSDLGKVKRNGKVLATRLCGSGYTMVTLSKGGVRNTCMVHRLVAKEFLPNPHDYPVINHKDEDKNNNAISNLEWCTQKYNVNYGDGIERRIVKQSKPVEQMLNGVVVRRWNSTSELRKSGYNYRHIFDCCNGRQKTAHGFTWRFAI